MLLELEHISKRYPAPLDAGNADVLRDVSLTLADGESVAIVGPSGSGKSTLLQIAGTIDRPSAGVVRLRGRDVTAL